MRAARAQVHAAKEAAENEEQIKAAKQLEFTNNFRERRRSSVAADTQKAERELKYLKNLAEGKGISKSKVKYGIDIGIGNSATTTTIAVSIPAYYLTSTSASTATCTCFNRPHCIHAHK